jgi:hypothetical protein
MLAKDLSLAFVQLCEIPIRSDETAPFQCAPATWPYMADEQSLANIQQLPSPERIVPTGYLSAITVRVSLETKPL